MTYSEEEIQKYLNILRWYNSLYDDMDFLNHVEFFGYPFTNKVSWNNCNNTHFYNNNGYRYCNKCDHSTGHILGYNEITENDRCHFYQKSIYKRRYHYQNKIEESNTKFDLNLSSDEKYELLVKLRKIDNVEIKKINEKFKRKRLINITYIIKKLLSDYDIDKANKIELNLSEKILNFYNNWYDDVKENLKI